MAAWYITEIITYEEIQIYSFVISFFSIIFHEKLNSGPILTLQRLCHCTIQNGGHWGRRIILEIMSFLSTYFFIWKRSGTKKYFWNQELLYPVNCPRRCSILSCDYTNEKLRSMTLFKRRWQEGRPTLCHCVCHNNLPHQDGSMFPWRLFFSTKNPLTIQYIFKGNIY